MKLSALALSTLMVLSVVSAGIAFTSDTAAAAEDIYVDGSTGSGDGSADDPYETIQTAVDNANSGDTIIVESGTYSESVTVDRSVTLKANGTVTLDGSGIDDFGFEVTADDVTIEGFTVENYLAGIEARSVNPIEVDEVEITGSESQGILFENVDDSFVQNSTISENNMEGILLDASNNNTIRHNLVEQNLQDVDANESRQRAAGDEELTENDVIIATDVSGSMGSELGGAAQEGAMAAIDVYTNDTQIGLTSFGEAGYLDLGLHLKEDNVSTFNDTLQRYEFDESSSHTAEVINLSVDELVDNGRSESNRTIMLIGDGATDDEDQTETNVDAAKSEHNIRFVTLGLEYDGDFLKYIAGTDAGNESAQGDFVYAESDNASEAYRDFAEEINDPRFSGIRLIETSSHDNTIYNNHLNNSKNVESRTAGINDWNVPRETGRNILGVGNESVEAIGGNFYATPEGDGISETCDNIVDTYFCGDEIEHDSNNTDSNALIRPDVRVTDVEATNPAPNDLKISIDTDQQLTDLTVDLSGEESATLSLDSVNESQEGDFSYTYTTTLTDKPIGDYTVEVTEAIGENGEDGSAGESDTVYVSALAANDDETNTTEGTPVEINVTENDQYFGSVNVTNITDGPENGTATIVGENNHSIEFTPDEGYEGDSTITYELSDGEFTDTADLTVRIPPVIEHYRVTNPEAENVSVLIDASEELAEIDVSISGAESGALDESDFTATEVDGNYTHKATYEGSETKGRYYATLDTANDTDGHAATTGQRDSVYVNTEAPTITTFDAESAGSDSLDITIESDDSLSEIEVDITGPDGESATLDRDDFSKSWYSDTYTGTYEIENDAGEYEATLRTATNSYDNDGADDETATVTFPEPPDEGTIRAAEKDGAIFLGGDFIELGIRSDGGFGVDTSAPSEFFGSDRGWNGEIGMYADVDGFYNDTHDYRYEYFLPGSPEERFSAGYHDGGTQYRGSAGQNVWSSPIDTTIDNDTTSEGPAAVTNSTYKDLEIDQRHSFNGSSRHYKTTVTLTNPDDGSGTIDDVRFQRSFDPDNGVDLGCSFTTNNTIVNQQPNDGEALVKAQITDYDSCGVTDVSKIPIFYYSQDSDARVSTGASSSSLIPDTPPYGDGDYDNPQSSGTNIVDDTYIAITFENESLADGESVTYSYYTALTKDVDTTLREVQEEAGPIDETDPNAAVGEDRTVSVGSPVHFDGSASVDNETNITSYEWEFGDGTTDTGATPTHRYDEAGTYTATLTVSDISNNTDSANVTITVEEPPEISAETDTTGFVEFRDPVIVDSNLTLSSTSDLDGARVSIGEGFQDGDTLAYNDSVAPDGITGTYDSDTGILSFEGTASASEYESLLRTVTYENTNADPVTEPRSITFTMGADTLYSEETGHYYESVSDSAITWQNASANASQLDHFGLQGYLATVTSEAENEFLVDKLQEAGWIGASDNVSEGTWRWVTGPEGQADGGTGQHFFTQTASYDGEPASVYDGDTPGGGTAIEEAVTNWATNEPNEHNGEDYAHLLANGKWSDIASDSSEIDGYLVEYGGMADDPSVNLSDETTVTVTRDEPPNADAGENVTIDEDQNITFSANGSSDDHGIESYDWDFDDGERTTGANPTHNYSEDGNYTLELTVTDTQGQTATDTISVTVEANSVIAAHAGANVTTSQDSVFELNASGTESAQPVESYTWDTGTGDTVTGERPTYVYEAAGTYNVTLTVTDSEGVTATDSTFVTVRDTTDPEAAFNSSAPEDEDASIDFDASSSSDNVGIASYEWDFDDNGRTDATGETADYTFSEPGTHPVTLTVTDEAGNTATNTTEVEVRDATPPSADAGENITTQQGVGFTLDANNSTDNAEIKSYKWDIDGEVVTGKSVDYRLKSTGEYDVTLTVTDEADNTDTDTLTVTVEEGPSINTSDGAEEYREARDPEIVDDSLTVTPNETTFSGATVSVNEGFEHNDVLSLNHSLAAQYGITGTYNDDTGVLSLSGTANGSEYEEMLRTVTFENEGTDTSANRTISFTLGADSLHSEETGSYYEFVRDSGITWHDARDAAAERSHKGLQGYLATVTSDVENDFISDKLEGSGWMGASDNATEGEWRWVTGPEGTEDGGDGRHFFTQTSSVDGRPIDVYDGNRSGGGDAVGDNYENWDWQEPNNWGSGEDYGHFWSDGSWNDYEYDNSGIDGYVVEYGGTDGDPELNLSATKTIHVLEDEPPTAAAESDMTVGTSDDLEFNGTNSTDDFGIEDYEWDLGDGTTQYGNTTIYSYDEDGNYTVTLTVTDTAFQSAKDTFTVRVINDSILSADPGGNYTVDEDTEFTLDAGASEASAGIAGYEWDLLANDSVEYTGETATHTFSEPGTYAVNLTVTDDSGFDNTVESQTHVIVEDVTDPRADAGSNVTVSEDESVTFDASSSSDNVGIDTYEWDYTGDGDADLTGETTNHTFTTPGNYTVNLTATDAAGNAASDTVTVVVEDETPPMVDPGSDRTVEVNEPVTFDGTNTIDDSGIAGYAWDFDDGGTATGGTPTHTYTSTGTYDVALNVTDTAGNAETNTTTVEVVDTMPPISNYTVRNPDEENITVRFDTNQSLSTIDVSITGAETATLDSEDFSETRFENGTYEYETTYEGSTDGNYTATVESAVDSSGNDGADGESVTVTTLGATATAGSYVVAVGASVELSATNTLVPPGATPTYEWNVSETESAVDHTGEIVNHAFQDPGEQSVTLNVSDGSDHEQDTLAIRVEDRTDPTVALADGESVENGTETTFNASESSDNVGITEYEWEFGDGETTTGTNRTEPSHTYTTPGVYTVTVTGTDDAGNADTNTTEVTVLGPEASVESRTLEYGDTPVDATNTMSLGVTNDGTVPLEVTGLPIDGSNTSAFTVTDGTPPFTIGAGETRNVPVEFSPADTDKKSATVTVATNHTNHSVDLAGSGVTSDLNPTDSSISVNDTRTGESTTAELTIDNDGGATADIGSALVADGDVDAFSVSGVPDSIAGESSETLDIAYEPQAPGNHSATLKITNRTNDTAVTVPLNGHAIGPEASARSEAITYTDVGKGTTAPGSVDIENVGNRALNVTDVRVVGPNESAFTVERQPDTLAVGASESVNVAFSPEAAGEYEATLVVESNDTSPTKVALDGSAIAAKIDADPRTANFDSVAVNDTANMRITVKNLQTSETDLSVSDTSISGTDSDAFAISQGDAPFTLAPGEKRYLNVSYAPKTPGEKSAQLQIHSDAGNEPQINVWLSSTDTYVVVQEVEPGVNNTNRTVNMDAANVKNGTEMAVNVSQPSTRATAVGADSLNMTVDGAENFEINTTHSVDPVGTDSASYTGTESVVQYVRLDHTTNASETYSDTDLTYRVKRSALPDGVGSDSVTLRRYNTDEEAWNTMEQELIGESSSHYIYRAETPGFSQFVITAREPAEQADLTGEEFVPETSGPATIDVPLSEIDDGVISIEDASSGTTVTAGGPGESISAVGPLSVDGLQWDVGTDRPFWLNVTTYTEDLRSENPEKQTPEAVVLGAESFESEVDMVSAGYVHVEHNLGPGAASNVTFTVSVDRSYLADLDVEPEQVALYRQDGEEWSQLPTTHLGDTATRHRFEVESPGFSVFALGTDAPRFGIEDVELTPEEVTAGETATVTAQLKNRGDVTGTQTVILEANGTTIDSQTVTVAPNSTESLAFEVSQPVGEWELTLNNQSAGTLTVIEAADTTTEAETRAPDDMGRVLLLLVGGGLGLVVIALAVLAVRRREDDEED